MIIVMVMKGKPVQYFLYEDQGAAEDWVRDRKRALLGTLVEDWLIPTDYEIWKKRGDFLFLTDKEVDELWPRFGKYFSEDFIIQTAEIVG